MITKYRWQTRPEAPATDIATTNKAHYSKFYKIDKSDSPDASRVSLLRRFRQYASCLEENDWVLDLGSGRQELERQYIATRGKPPYHIVTLDIADLNKSQLMPVRKGVQHVTGNGEYLPFGDNSFPLAVSNMALDFMPERAIEEFYRVLKPGGRALINLHHPSLIPDNLEYLLERKLPRYLERIIAPKHRNVLIFWKYLRDNGILFSTTDEIRDAFNSHGFYVERVEEVQDKKEEWWEVDMMKT